MANDHAARPSQQATKRAIPTRNKLPASCSTKPFFSSSAVFQTLFVDKPHQQVNLRLEVDDAEMVDKAVCDEMPEVVQLLMDVPG